MFAHAQKEILFAAEQNNFTNSIFAMVACVLKL
jgi:hypothetical protein